MQEWIIAMLVIGVLLLLRDMAKTIFSEMKKSAAALDYDRHPQKEKMQRYAEKAVVAGNDGDARQFLEKKQQLAGKQAGLQQAYDQAHQNAVKMKEMHDKLIKDIGELNARRDSIKAKMAVAKTQERLNKIGSSVEGAAGNLSAFDRMEEKANRMLDEANAMAELNASSASDDIDDLAAKYDDPSSSPAVDDELAALKAKLGK